MKINRFSIALAIMACSLLSAGCQRESTHSFAPSPDGRVIASIRVAEVIMPAPDNAPVKSHKSYLRIQSIHPSTESTPTETLITNERDEQYFLHAGGLTWRPNSRSVAFTTGNVAVYGRQPCRLWVVGKSAKSGKTLIAENVHSFRWQDDTGLVYVTDNGEVCRATISDDGTVLKRKTLFPGGSLGHGDALAYHYCGLSGSGGYAFNNPLSPYAHCFVYAKGGSLTIVNVSTATVEKSFPLIGTPISFWWDDASSNLVIGVQKKKDSYLYTHHYYLYQREKGTLTNLANLLEGTSQFSPYQPASQGRVWCNAGKQFVLNSGYPYYKTWLFSTAPLSAAWMEREIKRMKAGTSSQLMLAPLPLGDLEYDSSRDPLPALPDWGATNYESMQQKRNKMIDANSASRVAIEPSPRGGLLAVSMPAGRRRDAKSTSTCYVLKIGTGPKGKMSLAIQTKMEVGRGEEVFWTADGRGLLFVASDALRWESIP